MSHTQVGRIAVLDQTIFSFNLHDQIIEHFNRRFLEAGEPSRVALFALIHAGDVHGLVVPEFSVVYLPTLLKPSVPGLPFGSSTGSFSP